jgi:hypothetical protein
MALGCSSVSGNSFETVSGQTAQFVLFEIFSCLVWISTAKWGWWFFIVIFQSFRDQYQGRSLKYATDPSCNITPSADCRHNYVVSHWARYRINSWYDLEKQPPAEQLWRGEPRGLADEEVLSQGPLNLLRSCCSFLLNLLPLYRPVCAYCVSAWARECALDTRCSVFCSPSIMFGLMIIQGACLISTKFIPNYNER